MNKRQKYIAYCLTAFLFVSAFVFFAVFYRGHLFYNEQYQLFQFTSAYFLDLFRLPGGFAAWCSRFLIQFFLFPVVGGLIYACAITGVQLLCSAFAAQRNFLSTASSFIPAFILWTSLCQEYSQIVLAVNVIFCLVAALLCLKSRHSSVLFIVLTPILYWLCGFAAIIFVMASLSDKKWWTTAFSLAILVSLPFILRPFVRFDIEKLFKGFYYYKDPEMIFTWPWVAFGAVAAYVALFSTKIKENVIAAYASASFAIVAGVASVIYFSDFKLEEEMVYSNLVRNQKWDAVIRKANKKSPMNVFSVANLNLALAMKGRLGEDMFKYVQPGVDGLVPPYRKCHGDNLVCSDIFYYLALPSPSQRHMFECKESIPSMEKGSRMYQRLAQTNSINNQFAASRKYLDALSTTLFYRKWAENFDDYSADLVHFRELRYHKKDFFFSHDNLLFELGALYQENTFNDLAFQYAVAYTLLNRDLDSFKKVTSLRQFHKIPRSYQEAFLIVWTKNHTDLNGLPGFISSAVSKRFERFVDATNKDMNPEELYKKFGDTYWFYYYYNITE